MQFFFLSVIFNILKGFLLAFFWIFLRTVVAFSHFLSDFIIIFHIFESLSLAFPVDFTTFLLRF